MTDNSHDLSFRLESIQQTYKGDLDLGAFSFVPLSEFVGRPSWTKSG